MQVDCFVLSVVQKMDGFEGSTVPELSAPGRQPAAEQAAPSQSAAGALGTAAASPRGCVRDQDSGSACAPTRIASLCRESGKSCRAVAFSKDGSLFAWSNAERLVPFTVFIVGFGSNSRGQSCPVHSCLGKGFCCSRECWQTRCSCGLLSHYSRCCLCSLTIG